MGTQLRNNCNPLLDALSQAYDLEELRTLCFELQIDFDSLPGEGKLAKARELIRYCQRRQLLEALVAEVSVQRPHLAAQLATLPQSQLRVPEGPAWRAWPWWVQVVGAVVLILLLGGLAVTGYSYRQNLPDVAVAKPGETLVLIAAFRGPSQGDLLPEQRLDTALRRLRTRLPELNLRVELVPDRIIASEKQASEWGQRYKAKLVIWGWYDASSVSANLVFPERAGTTAIEQDYTIERIAEDAGWQLNQLLPNQVGLVSQVALGWLAFTQGDDDQALQLWDEVLAATKAESPERQAELNLDELYYLHGITASRRGDQAQAAVDFAEAERINPQHWQAVYQNAELAYNEGQYLVAQEKLQRIIAAAPSELPLTFGYALRLAAIIQYRNGKIDEAIALAQQATHIAPSQSELWIVLSGLYLTQATWTKAAQAAEQAVALQSGTAWGEFNLGRASLHLGEMDKAKDAYRVGLAKLNLPADQSMLDEAIDELVTDRQQFPELAGDIDVLLQTLKAPKAQ